MSNIFEGVHEINLNNLLKSPELQAYIAYEPKLGSLPFDLIAWPTFEKLSARLLETVPGGKLAQAFTYGRPGQAQYGIDVIALKASSSKKTVLQSKRVRAVNRGELRQWIAIFLSNRKTKWADVDHYILSVPCQVESDAKLVDEWLEQERLLSDEGISAELWSLNRLHSMLRDQPGLIAEFFGDRYVSSFCAVPPVPDRYPDRYRREFKSQNENYFVFENETARLDIFVPDDRRPRLSASLSFARADLSGITFTIPSSSLVDWFQWIVHANDTSKPPYALPASGFEGRHIFCAPDVRLMLDDSELEHINWIFKNAWLVYRQAISEIEAKWRFLRFDKIEEAQKCTFALAKVSRQLWRTILEFSREHDCSHGDSDWHIFDGATGVLKVYVETTTERLERGYHMIMYGYQEGGIVLPHEDSIVLGWAPLTSISDEPVEMHPRLAWDAEYTHQWIFSKLVPGVKKWIERKQAESNNSHGILNKFIPRRCAEVDLSPHIYSLQRMPVRFMSGDAVILADLVKYTEILQSFFHVYRRAAPVSGEAVVSILSLLIRLFSLVEAPDDHYIRGNLHLGDGPLSTEISKVIHRGAVNLSNPTWLDMSLRSLIAMLRDAKELPASERVFVGEVLSPLWERMAEDRLCDSLR